MHMHRWVEWDTTQYTIHVKVRRPLVEVSSLLLYGTWELNLGCRAWWQAPLCTEPSHQRNKINSYRHLLDYFNTCITFNSNDENNLSTDVSLDA